jgi:hypothetical protein
VSFVWEVVVVELTENCCGLVMGAVQELGGSGIWTIGSLPEDWWSQLSEKT